MLTGSEFSENDISSSAAKLVRSGASGYIKIESELIDSMELECYSYYIYHADELQRSFNLLADIKSKKCFLEHMRTVLENDFWRIESEPLICKYWGVEGQSKKSLYRHIDDENWLNIGSCNGDTIFRYIMNGYCFSKIHAVDADLNSIRRCRSNLELLNNKETTDKISLHNILLGCGEDKVKIDNLFADEKLTLINMDIEGAETDTLKSASKLIKRDRPVLAVCIYHKPEHLTELVETIYDMCSDYYFYLRKYPNYPYHRYNSKEEVVLYAIPADRIAD